MHLEYKIPEESDEELEDAVASHVRAWEFKGDETMHPFWAVEFLTEEERRKAQKGAFNLKFEDKEFSAVTVGTSGGDSIAITLAVVVPIMTNAVDVKMGDDLLLQVTSPQSRAKRKAGSWKDDVEKPRAKAKATTAPSLQLATEI